MTVTMSLIWAFPVLLVPVTNEFAAFWVLVLAVVELIVALFTVDAVNVFDTTTLPALTALAF